MPDGIQLGKAYVQVIPTTKGITQSVSDLLGADGESAGTTFGEKFSGALGKAGKLAVTGIGAATTAAATAVSKVMTDSVAGFADYQQLVGGVETLFKDSADVVKGYAENAYSSAGLSANEYMETVTSFSASLLQSVGGDTARAANLADQAIIDMADNANKMGSSMESIQNAYQSFSRGQFQLLDNLKLGYGGTQAEMQRLLEDATALSGVEYDISSYADIVEAIHVVQDNLEISGTTAKEAGETISGSLAATKSAWENLLVGLADDNADVGKLVGNLVDTAGTALTNLIPVAEQALSGIVSLIGEIGPVLAEKLPEIIESLLPGILNAAINLVGAVVKNLPSIIASLLKALVSVGKELISALWDGLVSGAEWLMNKLGEGFRKIVDWVKRLLGINSPSKVWESLGSNSAIGFANGWSQEFSSVSNMVSADVSGMVSRSGSAAYYASRGNVRYGNSNYYVNIDAKNVREFNDIIYYAQNAQRLGRQYG